MFRAVLYLSIYLSIRRQEGACRLSGWARRSGTIRLRRASMMRSAAARTLFPIPVSVTFVSDTM